MKCKVIRDRFLDDATTGRMYIEDEFVAFTIEQPWNDNKKGESCIPLGIYELNTKRYGRFWDKYEVEIPILYGTAPRTEILIHPANYAHQVEGCIAVGSSKDDDIPAVWNSVSTWKKILPLLYECDTIEIV